jgi:hypothetical protein
MTRSLHLRKVNITANVRRLGRWLLDNFGPPSWAILMPIRESGPIDHAEFAFLSALASEHEALHSIEMIVEGRPSPARCESYGRRCRAFGVARALRLGLDGVMNIRRRRLLRDIAASVEDARLALAEADRALALYLRGARGSDGPSSGSTPPTDHPTASSGEPIPPGKAATDHHGVAVAYILHDHEHACVLPASLGLPIRELRASFGRFATLGLGPVLEAHRDKSARPGQKRRPPVLALMEEAMSAEGWKHREVVEMIDDGYGGTLNQRMDRMRKAIAGERLWRSTAPDGGPDTTPKRRRA